VTPIEHLLRDYREGPAWSRRQHFEEWTRLVKTITDAGKAAREVDELMAKRASIHFHVWTQAEMLEMLAVLRTIRAFDIELMFRRDNEVIFVLRMAAPSVERADA